ncbi:hypothetical protein [Altererythrobacter sp. GH1-8]|uniref:hypothetical protein n=1 Tax=Altererythrobacter sp. GH1-8 TaxID=3349333 RepID=UPI00374CBFAC
MGNLSNVHAISSRIHGIEDRLDLLLAEAGELMAEMTKYRIETDMDANVGQRALTRLAEMQSSLVEARLRACGTHSDLKKIIETSDIPFTCPKLASEGPKTQSLRLAG